MLTLFTSIVLTIAFGVPSMPDHPLADVSGIRSAFNAARGKVRIVMLVSPTCPMCVSGADVIRSDIVGKLKDKNLAAFSVFIPMLMSDGKMPAIGVTALFLVATCTGQSHKPTHNKMHLELLVFEGCPNSPKMRANLTAALKSLGLANQFETVDLTKLPKGDPRLGYGAPTILLNGADLFGQKRGPATGSLSCRLYAGDAPSARAIAAKFK